MEINKEQIEHLAQLARLQITEAEKEKYAEQISSILGYFEELQSLNLSAKPLAQAEVAKVNVLRTDEVKCHFDADKTLAEAPKLEKRQIKVKNVFER